MEIAAEVLRSPIFRLTRYTGWALSEIAAMSVRRFIWWLEGLPKK
jgi:hypothetical protein